MPRNFSELKSGGDNSYAVPRTLKSGRDAPPPSPTDRRPWTLELKDLCPIAATCTASFRCTLVILHLSRLRRNINRNVYKASLAYPTVGRLRNYAEKLRGLKVLPPHGVWVTEAIITPEKMYAKNVSATPPLLINLFSLYLSQYCE